jgi:transcriptional regulator with XRE-family HTH domain
MPAEQGSTTDAADGTIVPEPPGDGEGDLATPPTGEGAVAAMTDDERYQRRLGERLRAVRRTQGLRLQDVEINSEGRFKAVVVGSYERGDRAVSAHKLAALADFYGVPVTELLPDEAQPHSGTLDDGVRLAVDRLLSSAAAPETAPLLRLVQHVQWLRGDYSGRVLSLRGDDLRTVAVALDVPPDGLGDWLHERGLLVS